MSTPPLPPSPPPRRYMSPTGRIVIPALFVVLLIVVLGRPILISGLDLDTEERQPPTAVETDGNREREPREPREPRGPSRLAAPYPKACLAAAPRPGIGLIAASAGATVTAASPRGAGAFALQARPPIGFSASGRYLATAGGELWSAQGRNAGLAFGRPLKRWAWSPVADCIAGVDKGLLVVARPRSKPVTLVEDVEVSTFSFSPDGTRLLFAVEGKPRSRGLWVADLASRKVRVLQPSLGWTLMGWSKKNRPVLFREGATGVPASGEALSFPPSDTVSRCGDEIAIINRNRISNIGVSTEPRFISADSRFRYTAVACAPNTDLLVVVRHEKGAARNTSMAVLRRDGAFVREVAQQSRTEDAPMWGPPGTGVVFVGDAGGEGAAGPLVWFLPEGATARPTGLRVERLGDDIDARLDWSATPPLGHPTR